MKFNLDMTGLLLAIGVALSAPAAAQDYGGETLCEYRVPSVPVWSGQDEPQPGDAEFEDYMAVMEMDGRGGPEPLLYDSFTGVWVDPVSGEVQTAGGEEFGHATDAETGARFEIARGLWVDPATRKPLRSQRLNDVPYFDWKTGEAVDVRTGARSDMAPELLTLGQIRQARFNTRYACLGDDLSQRIDPISGRYLTRPDGSYPDANYFPTMNEANFERRMLQFQGGRDVTGGLPRFNNFSEEHVREQYDLTNGESRNDVVAKLYDRLAPESAEGGGQYKLVETRTFDDGLIVLATATGLLDDALSAEQVIVFFDTSMGGRPRLMNAGIRRICGRMNSHSGWTLDRC